MRITLARGKCTNYKQQQDCVIYFRGMIVGPLAVRTTGIQVVQVCLFMFQATSVGYAASTAAAACRRRADLLHKRS